MIFFNSLVITLFCAVSAIDSQIDRQNTDNYDSLNRYKSTDSSSYSTSGGYYPRNVYEQFSQSNRLNGDLRGREFRPPNVFAAGLLGVGSPTPYMSPLMAQPRQYQISMSGPTGLMPYQVNGSPLLQGTGNRFNSNKVINWGLPPKGYSLGGTIGSIGSQFSGLNSPINYGGVPNRLGIGESASNYGYGNYMSDPYYGVGNRQSMAISPVNPYSIYGAQGLYSSPYLSQSANYQPLSYANPTSGYLSRDYAAYGFGPQYAGHPYQSQALSGGQLAFNNGYSNYNNYNNNQYSSSGLGSGQSGDSIRDEKSYASSASTQTETQSGEPSNDVPVYHSNRIIKRKDIKRTAGDLIDHRMTE